MSTQQNPTPNLIRIGKILASTLLLQLASIPAVATVIDYRYSSAPNDLTVSSYNYGGVTVTGGAGLLFINVSNGISVYGDNQYSIDLGEYVDFSFDAGSATGISLFTQGGPTGTIDIAGFGLSGYLGTQSVSVTGLGPALDISGLFGNAALSHFTMTTTAGAHRPYMLSFDDPASVPDTGATLLLLASGLGVLMAARHGRRPLAKAGP
jgi:hypothetical protein